MTPRERECLRIAPTIADLVALQDRYELETGHMATGDAVDMLEEIEPDYCFIEED